MNSRQRSVFLTLWCVYLFLLIYILLMYQRQLDFSWWVYGGWSTLMSWMAERINLIPFRTISRYLLTMNYATGMRSVLINIGGHMVLFSPLGFFLPRLRPWFQSWLIFSVSVLGLITVLEFLQLVSMSGSFDVDDILLNVFGALLGFIFLRNPEGKEESTHG